MRAEAGNRMVVAPGRLWAGEVVGSGHRVQPTGLADREKAGSGHPEALGLNCPTGGAAIG